MKNIARNRVKHAIYWTILYGTIGVLLATFVVFASGRFTKHTQDIEGSITLTTSKLRYKKGQTVYFTVKNDTPEAIYVTNNCPDAPLQVYRWTDPVWKRVHSKADVSVCDGQARKIKILAHDTLSGSYDDWKGIFKTPGIYRIALIVEGFSGTAYYDIEILAPKEKEKADSVPAPTPQPPQQVIPQPTPPLEHQEIENDDQRENEPDEPEEHEVETDDL